MHQIIFQLIGQKGHKMQINDEPNYISADRTKRAQDAQKLQYIMGVPTFQDLKKPISTNLIKNSKVTYEVLT